MSPVCGKEASNEGSRELKISSQEGSQKPEVSAWVTKGKWILLACVAIAVGVGVYIIAWLIYSRIMHLW